MHTWMCSDGDYIGEWIDLPIDDGLLIKTLNLICPFAQDIDEFFVDSYMTDIEEIRNLDVYSYDVFTLNEIAKDFINY